MTTSYQQQTKDQLQHIDGQLDSLVEITAEQVTGAKQIGSELDGQAVMIAGINSHMDRTQTGIEGATTAVMEVKPGAGSWISWILALVLLALILVLGIFWHPKKK
jgi:hypothetical protein